jgi:phosphoribosylformylglycinamidine synthase subunit PurSL
VTLWEIDIYPAPGQPDVRGRSLAAEAADLGLGEDLSITAGHGFLIEGALDESQIKRLAAELLSGAALREHAQGDDLRRHAGDPPQLGDDDWCVSVFKDNAGVVRFDDEHNVCFKVETHNHPSAIEPYGGANTGIGGVIRDPLGTGLGAKPICNTDVFCFAPPDMPPDELPPGVLHPRRVMKGVVAGVRDYGNRMGIPTVNGAVYFDERYLGNPLVYCGNVGLIPRDKSFKQPRSRRPDRGDRRPHRARRHPRRDVQLGRADHDPASPSSPAAPCRSATRSPRRWCSTCCCRPATEGLYTPSPTAAPAGFSAPSARWAPRSAPRWLERAPLKYEGSRYTEIWISEAQERMVLAVPPGEKWPSCSNALCASEDVEATVIGTFTDTAG